MAKIALNKSALQKARVDLKLYQRLLPSLDLKRMQLTAELKRAQKQFENAETEVESLKPRAAEQLPMLANEEIDVSGLVQLDFVQVGEENVVGVKLPILEEIQCSVREYSMLAKPHWVDVLVDLLKQMAELQAQVKVSAERVRLLEQAVRRTTQRVNLFDKILIPTTKTNIKRIQIFLGDTERAAVVRSKIAKSRHIKQRLSMADEGAQA